MFSIGFFEIMVIAVLGLLVFGPEKLPDAIRTIAMGVSKAKRSWNNTRRDLEQELGMDEIRREIHNAQVMEDLELIKRKTAEAKKELSNDLNKTIGEESSEDVEAKSEVQPAHKNDDAVVTSEQKPTSESDK